MLACGATRTKDDDVATDDTDADSDVPTYQPDTDLKDTSAAPSAVSLELTNFPFVVEEGDTDETVTGVVRSKNHGTDALTWSIVSDRDGLQPAPVWTDAKKGRFRWPTASLKAGFHTLTFGVADPNGDADDAILGLDVCKWPALQDFDGNPIGDGWQAFGNASWDPGGWMEITGNYQSRAGSIYKTDTRINPGDVRIEFDIATGGGLNSGADGYAVNIVDVPEVTDLIEYIGSTANGGCLGYGSSGKCGTYAVNSFHIEFDSWYNAGDPVVDPTSANHVAITLDGDPGDHLLWVATQLEDNALRWKHVIVETQGQRVVVTLDGSVVIDATLPGFTFDGGWIGVSGSTGWASNYHRFDNLLVRDRCQVPP